MTDIIGPLPFELVNGQIADGSQVQADLDKIRDDVNAFVSLAPGTGNVIGPASAVDENVAVFDGTTGKLIKDGGVILTGPASAIDENVAVFDGVTGKIIKDGGTLSTLVNTIIGGSTTEVPEVGGTWTLDFTVTDPDTFNEYVYIFSRSVYFDPSGLNTPGCTVSSATQATSAYGGGPHMGMSVSPYPSPSTNKLQWRAAFNVGDTSGVIISQGGTPNPAIPQQGYYAYDGALNLLYFRPGDRLCFKMRPENIPSGLSNVQVHLAGTYI
ncbi:hypothetical protein KAR91_18220 [Candidatus Pacearchaeota archaeon]|nr:hypothetical protein [Candidatus Pacearchaeota archaeon]